MNIVFDLGGVVFTWNPDVLISEHFQDPAVRQIVKAQLFKHPDWVELDRGTLDREEAIERVVQRTGLDKKPIVDLIYSIPEKLIPIPETIDYIKRLRAANNHKLYILSNMHHASINYLEQFYDFWPLFDGKVISCRINMVKPEPEIYFYLLKRYNLEPGQTVFIDDTQVNLDTAAQLGITTVKFENAEQCERE